MSKEKNKTPDDNSKCWNERDSSHVVTTVTDILLSIYCCAFEKCQLGMTGVTPLLYTHT